MAAPAFTLIFERVVGTGPPERADAAAARLETSAELGGALGGAILEAGMALDRRPTSAYISVTVPFL
jgi:hypothetical protein